MRVAAAREGAGSCSVPSPTTEHHSHGCHRLPLWQTQVLPEGFRRVPAGHALHLVPLTWQRGCTIPEKHQHLHKEDSGALRAPSEAAWQDSVCPSRCGRGKLSSPIACDLAHSSPEPSLLHSVPVSISSFPEGRGGWSHQEFWPGGESSRTLPSDVGLVLCLPHQQLSLPALTRAPPRAPKSEA